MRELEDQSWFPSILRNFQTEFIGYVVRKLRIYDVFIKHLKRLQLPSQSMTDLCAGSGEPAISIYKKSKCFNWLILTDKYPNAKIRKNSKITYDTSSIDVLKMDFTTDTYYTMFNAFHHFTDREKKLIVHRMQDSSATGFFVEILEPTFLCLLKVILVSIFGTLLFTPFIHPWSWKRLFFTYVLPLNTLTILIDGIISVYKSHTVQYYENLFRSFNPPPKIIRLNSFLNPLILIQI